MNGSDTYLDVNNSHLRVTSGNVYATGVVTTANVEVGGELTVTGNVAVDTDTLFVDSVNNRVGVGTTSPDYPLDVHGSANVGTITTTDINVTGNLTVLGTTTTLDTVNLRVKDPIIEIGKDNTASPVVDLGLILTRPATTSNVAIIFDETTDTLEIGYTQSNASDTDIIMRTAATEPLSVNVNGTISGNGSGLTALNATNITTGTLPVTRGGTGTTTSTGTGSVVLSAAPAFTGDVTFDTDTLKIDSTNNRVGIGTTSPEAKLHVKGGSICVHRTFPDTPDAGIVFMEDHSNKDCMFIAYDGGGVAETSDESLRFYSKSAGGADPTITGANLLMTLQGNGLVQFSYTEKFNLFYAPAAWGYSTTSTTDTNLWTFDVTIPQEGYLILNTNGHWNHSVAGYYIYAKIGVDSNDPSDTSGFYDSHTIGGASTNGGDFHSYKDSSVSWQDFNWSGILKVAAGTRTICMRVKTPQGGTVYINGAAVSMLYIPKNYF